MNRITWRGAAVALVLAGCSLMPSAYQAQVTQAIQTQSVAKPPAAVSSTNAAVIEYRHALFDLMPNELIGRYVAGFGCRNEEDLHWSGGTYVSDEEDFIKIGNQVFVESHYRVAAGNGGIVLGMQDGPADYAIMSVVTGMNAELCEDIRSKVTGVGELTIEWLVMSLPDEKVRIVKEYKGYASLKNGLSGGATQIMFDAFANSARQFASDPELIALVTGQAQISGSDRSATLSSPSTLRPASPKFTTQLSIPSIPRFSGSFAAHSAAIRKGVVVIDLGNGSFGSGFYISADGYILTNAHVTQGRDQVRVVDSDGTIHRGTVLREDRGRDVALVKVPRSGAFALPLLRRAVLVGEEVYAVGAPLDQALTGTVTKGIVSSLRTLDGYPFIQADVDVQPGNSGGPLTDSAGNVIGITEAIIGDGSSIGLNFFIPIDDALTMLGLSLD